MTCIRALIFIFLIRILDGNLLGLILLALLGALEIVIRLHVHFLAGHLHLRHILRILRIILL